MKAIENSNYKFAITNSEAKAKDAGLENDVIVFCKPENASRGKIFKGGVEYGSGGEAEESTFDEGVKSAIDIGGLKKGTNVGDKTALEVLDEIINQEYAPYLSTEGSITFEYNLSKVKEVGENTPRHDSNTSDFSVSATPKTIIGGDNYVATNDASNEINVTIDQDSTFSDFNTKTTTEGTFKVTASTSFKKGSSVVKSSKGKPTQKVGGTANNRKALSDASVSNDVDSNYNIKASTPTSKPISIEYVHAIYASTQSVGTLTKQAITKNTTITKLLKGSNEEYAKVALPIGYKNIKFEEPGIGGGYLDNTDAWVRLADTTLTNIGGDNVAYQVWGRKLGADTNVQISFTRK